MIIRNQMASIGIRRHTVTMLALIGLISSGCADSAQDSPVTGKQVASAPSDASSRRLRVPGQSDRPLSGSLDVASKAQLQQGWIALFDGQTLFGWVANSSTDWVVKNGAIVSASKPPGLLLTTTKFNDYELRCEVWLEPGGNSGLFLRTVPFPQDPASDCLEFNLCDGHESYPTGSLVGRDVAIKSIPIEGEWHQIQIRLKGPTLTARIDGTLVLDVESPDLLTTGGRRIGLQHNEGEVRVRNILLRPLGLDPIMNVASLAGWHTAPEGTSLQVTSEEDAVRIQGKGYLESEATYDDFVLQFEARMNADDSNSGLFFRAQPSTAKSPSNGYELQLQNTIANNDPTDPADYGDGWGTGAIFRRQPARYVNARDQQWFAVTLVARGNHFASWVNGLQVTDFTDTRPRDENPRKGRRDKAGHLSFQGHDAGTNISLRNLKLKKLESRSSEDGQKEEDVK